MGVQERAKNRERVDKDEKIKHLQKTILAYSERVNNYELQVDDLWKTIHEQLLIKDEQENTIEMYKIKVNRLRRTIGEYIDKYGLQ
tara:strand:+ start:237 stop:494 length:258 start_codon:yes stop_codon:yes gene_type:complete